MLSEEEQTSDTAAFKAFLQQHFKLLVIYAVAGGMLGFFITFFIPKEFQSAGNVYAPSTPSIEASIDNPNFGYDVEADRLIQILQSNEVRDSVVKRFGLLSQFDVNRNEPDWLDKLIKLYKRNITFERTPSMSILIKAQTRDPQLSADIVNFLMEITDVIREKLYKQNIKIAYQNALSDFQSQKSKTDSAQNVLISSLKKNNLNSLLLLASNAQISIDMDKLNSLSSNNDNVAIGSDIIVFKNMRDRLNESDIRLTRVKKALTNPIPKLYIIDKAEPRFKKVYPSGLLNSIIGALFSTAILMIGLLSRRFFGSN